MKITLAQLNPIVGDIEGNLARAIETFNEHKSSSDIVVFPEMFLVGYPAQDLLDRPSFIKRIASAIEKLRKSTAGVSECALLMGAPTPNTIPGQRNLHNSAVLYCDGQVLLEQHKTLLPTYDVFDEARYFQPANKVKVVSFKDEVLGISICEDAWTDVEFWPRGVIYDKDPIADLAKQGATVMINISASPFSTGKDVIRYRLLSAHAKRHKTPVVFVNQVGGNDELIFDGRSMSFAADGGESLVCKSFGECVQTIDTEQTQSDAHFTPLEEVSSIHDALILGLQDYMRKCGFEKVVVGLSGGIDSAVTLALAVRALGAEKTLGLIMPSRYSSPSSSVDADALAANLGTKCERINIDDIYQSYLDSIEEQIDNDSIRVVHENLQARIRGNLLMAFANEFGYLTLSTGNKSELAVGYCTLYGDMSGGLSLLADVPKTKVYALAEFMNSEGRVIPQAIIDKPASAELRPDQQDQDTLPPYDLLDQIIHEYIENSKAPDEIIEMGIPAERVRWVVKAINHNEYKRRQAAPGLRVTSKSFGSGRRMPIAAKYESSNPN